MVDKKLSFREKNRVRLKKKSEVEGKVSSGKVEGDCYVKGERSKVGDFFIGFGIFFVSSFFSFIAVILVGIVTIIYYKKWFGERRYVKYGMFSYFGFVLVMLLLLGLFIFLYFY